MAAALLPQVALAHAQLLQSDPGPNALLDAVPSTVSLLFTEPVTPAGAGIKVFSPSGAQVASRVVVRGYLLSATVNSAETGTYVVSWQVLAADTHPSRGSFAFVVGRPSPNPYSALLSTGEIGTTTPLGLALQALSRWVHFAGFALVFGVVAYQAVMRQKERARRLVGAGVVLLIAAEPLLLVAQLASLSFDGDTVIAVLASGFGRLLGLRLAAALLVWVVWTLDSPWPILGIGAVVAIVDGASAHAIQGLSGAGQVLTSVHVTAMGLWVGGVAAFISSTSPSTGVPAPKAREWSQRPVGASQSLQRFPRYALATFAVAAGTGVVLAAAHTNLFTALATDYAYVLMVKVLVVGAALAAALLRRRRMEFGLMVAVVGAAALLAALPPPR